MKGKWKFRPIFTSAVDNHQQSLISVFFYNILISVSDLQPATVDALLLLPSNLIIAL
jgi:hypothetical protein